jgi:hypothetical protein
MVVINHWNIPWGPRCAQATAVSIPDRKVGECWNSGLDGQLEAVVASNHLKAVAATSEAARIWETLPTASRVLGPYENHVTWKFDSWMNKNLNSELKKEESYTCDPTKRGVEGSPSALEHGLYGERPADCTNYVNHFLSNWIRQIEHIQGSYVQWIRCAGGYAWDSALFHLAVCLFPPLHCRLLVSGSGGTSTPLGITTMVHNPVAQNKPTIN